MVAPAPCAPTALGEAMPLLGFGVFQITDAAACEQSVVEAIDNKVAPAVNQIEVNPFLQQREHQQFGGWRISICSTLN